MPELPTGTVTFLFTDIEGSTRLLQQLGDRYASVLMECRQLLRAAFQQWVGYEVDTQGDAFFVAFARATDAVSAAVNVQRVLFHHPWPEDVVMRVRVGLHTGEPSLVSEGYVGLDVHHAARIMSAGHGGQVLLSQTTCDLVEHSLPEGVHLRDLGKHSLKDLQRPGHLFQLVIAGLPTDFPPLKSLDAHPNNLPFQPTPLVGRGREVTSTCGLLRRSEVRLVTLTGPAGVGKTRLGLQVAAELADQFADGVFAVFLAPVSDPDLVVSAITQTLGVIDMGMQPPLPLLKGALKDKHMLLLLDNFEQVVDAALLLADLLASCPRIKVLVTSRVVLHVRAEREFTVPPLSLPNLKHLPELVALSQYEAVALFIERALAVKPDFAVTKTNAPTVAGICTRLDGLPLAIELAAARVKYFPPQNLLARLEQGLSVLVGGARDLPVRQQTLRGALAWSYDLLEPGEQALFRRLVVFVDGCTWEAAEQVCTAAGTLQGDILEGLASLVDKSLLRQEEQAEGEGRFRMLQVLREFGLETLAGMGETEVTREAHALYYLRLSEEAEPYLKGAEQIKWFQRLEQEHENLRAALTWLLERVGIQQGTEPAEQALRLGAALCWFWRTRGYPREGQSFLEQALAGSTSVEATVRAKALLAAGELAVGLERTGLLSEVSLALSREVGDKHGMAASLFMLGVIARERAAFATARARLEEAAALFLEVGDSWSSGRCLTELARIFEAQGEYTQARLLLEESLGLYRALGDRERIGWVLFLLAEMLFASGGDPATVQSLAEECLKLVREVGYTLGNAHTLRLLGRALLAQGEAARANAVFEESAAALKEEWDRSGDTDALYMLAHVVAMQGNLEQARALYLQLLSLLGKLGVKGDIPGSMEGLATVLAGQGDLAWAARLWGAAEALREAIGVAMYPAARANYERAAARAQLGEEAFAMAWAEGRAMPLEQVIDEVLGMGE